MLYLLYIQLFYRILSSTIILVISIRLQIDLQPYKKEENNKIELFAITVGSITLFSGVAFEDQSGESTLQNLILAFVFFVNIIFILNWLYLFSKCMGEDYKIFNKVTLVVYHYRSPSFFPWYFVKTNYFERMKTASKAIKHFLKRSVNNQWRK